MFLKLLNNMESLLARTLASSSRRTPKRLRRGPGVRLELLEDRRLFHSEGIIFGTAPYLKLSFAPDDTEVAGNPSQLHALFDPVAPTEAWESTILSAFEAWTSITNADVGLVSDSGDPLGTPGNTVGDSRFGDIRVAASPLDPAIAAVAVAHDQPAGGTWVGDVIFNSDYPFSSLDEIYAVALHEAGHVFGIGHSEDPLSPMFEHGVNAARTLQTDDIFAIQSLYGQRGKDYNDADDSNGTIDDATRIRFAGSSELFDGTTPSLHYGDISAPDDVDVFELNLLDRYSGGVTFHFRTAGISLLQAQVTVSRANGTVLASAQSESIGGDEFVLNIPDIGGLNRLYVSISSLYSDQFAVGGYSLVTSYDATLAVPIDEILAAGDGRFRLFEPESLRKIYEEGEFKSPLLDLNDLDDSAATAVVLKTAPGFQRDTRFIAYSSIETTDDVDYFRFDAPSLNAETSLVGTIHVRSLDIGNLIPEVRVLNESGNAIDVTTIVHGGGDIVLQSPDMDENGRYFIEVRSADTLTGHKTGNYELTVSFGVAATMLDTLLTGVVSDETPRTVSQLYVAVDQFFHFVVASQTESTRPDVLLVASILAPDGSTVYRLAQSPGSVRSGQIVRLAPGEYQIVVDRIVVGDAPVLPIEFQIDAFSVSDPLSVPVDDPSADPLYTCDEVVDAYCYPNQNQTPTDQTFFATGGTGLPNTTTFTGTVISSLLLGSWWDWFQQQQPIDPSVGATSDSYQATGRLGLTVPDDQGVLANDTTGSATAHLLVSPVHGTLELQLDGSFHYQPDPTYFGTDSFIYVTAQQLSGAGYATVTLNVTPSVLGDANLDGVADGTDLSIWQQQRFSGPNQTWLDGDFSGDGYVDARDFIIWFANRFQSPQAISALASPTRGPRAASSISSNDPAQESATTSDELGSQAIDSWMASIGRTRRISAMDVLRRRTYFEPLTRS